MIVLPVTLSAAAAAALVNIWLAMRVGKVRGSAKIMHGDGNHPPLVRRMRAQLNYVENTPFVLLLIGAIELAGRGGMWLSAVAGLYFLGRVAHAVGMDREDVPPMRMAGVTITMLTLLGLAVFAALITAGVV